MPFFSLSRKSSQPSFTHAASDDAASNPLSGNSDELPHRRRNAGSTSSLPRLWRRKGASTTSRDSSSPPIESDIPIIPRVESSASDPAIREMPTPIPLPTGPDVVFTNFTVVPSTEMISTISPEPDQLAATWDQVKDGPKDKKVDRAIDVLGANGNLAGPSGILILATR